MLFRSTAVPPRDPQNLCSWNQHRHGSLSWTQLLQSNARSERNGLLLKFRSAKAIKLTSWRAPCRSRIFFGLELGKTMNSSHSETSRKIESPSQRAWSPVLKSCLCNITRGCPNPGPGGGGARAGYFIGIESAIVLFDLGAAS